jgi:hypothetical protein
MPCPELRRQAFINWMTNLTNPYTKRPYPRRTPTHYADDIEIVQQEFSVCMEPVALDNATHIISLLVPENPADTRRAKRLGNYRTAIRTYFEFATGQQLPGARLRQH